MIGPIGTGGTPHKPRSAAQKAAALANLAKGRHSPKAHRHHAGITRKATKGKARPAMRHHAVAHHAATHRHLSKAPRLRRR